MSLLSYKIITMIVISLLIYPLLCSIEVLALSIDKLQVNLITVEIISPHEGFNFSTPFEIRFRIINNFDREVVFRRIRLFVQLKHYNWTLWDTWYNGDLRLKPRGIYEGSVICDLATYRGPIRIVLYYQVRINGRIISGFQAVNGYYIGSPRRGDIGLYGLPPYTYSKLIKLLKELGFSVVYVDKRSFRNVKIVIMDCYTLSKLRMDLPSEDELKEYIMNGGGLWIINMPCGNFKILGVESSPCIIEVTVIWISELRIKEHEITRGIRKVFLFGTWLWRIPDNVEELIRLNGRTVLAVQELGLGKIVWTGGSGSFSNCIISQWDNEKLAKNIIIWLSKPISYEGLRRKYVELMRNYETLKREYFIMRRLVLIFFYSKYSFACFNNLPYKESEKFKVQKRCL